VTQSAASKRRARQRRGSDAYVQELREEASRFRSRLADAEASIERVQADAAEEVARLTGIVTAARERADAAEAKLSEAVRP
jgi:chromosome segregation ATPase